MAVLGALLGLGIWVIALAVLVCSGSMLQKRTKDKGWGFTFMYMVLPFSSVFIFYYAFFGTYAFGNPLLIVGTVLGIAYTLAERKKMFAKKSKTKKAD